RKLAEFPKKRDVKQKPKVSDTVPRMIGSESFITVVYEGRVFMAGETHPNFKKAHEMLKAGDVKGAVTCLDTQEAIRTY
ncbi:hypothetical protein, partial [Enterobacter hormaechei]